LGAFSFVSWNWSVWMGLTTLFFWLAPSHSRTKLLFVATVLFLAITDLQSCALLGVMTFMTYIATDKKDVKGKQVFISIGLIVCILFFYKWMKASLVSVREFGVDIIIPLGLSYYSLRCIHFILERYKGKIGSQDIQNLVAYLFFLPTIWIGPIHCFEDYIKDLRRHRWDAELFSRGLERILYGYVKVVILGNVVLNTLYPQWVSSLVGTETQLAQYLELVRGGLEIYLLFSGYSDIAIGFGNLLGFKIMENFKWPYFQKNISSFWQSWHISLTSWCRRYIYTTVIASTRSPALGVISTLIIIGLWHELSVRYILWGLYHGIGIVVWQYSQGIREMLPTINSKATRLLLDYLSIFITVHFVWLSFLLVKQPNIESIVTTMNALFLGVF